MTSPRPSGEIHNLPAPLSELPWSADFVMQAIELLPVTYRDGQLLYYKPEHAESFVVGWPAGGRPEDVSARAVEALGLRPRVLHSTSWRHGGNEVLLTYLVVVEGDASVPSAWEVLPVVRSDLARGDAITPPPVIGVGQVLEHALRHLSWLTRDDAAIAAELPDWRPVLEGYVPEPFRALGPPPA
jgi:hypothetical protein